MFVTCIKPWRQQITSGVTHDVDFPTVYRRIYSHKFLTLSNQTSRYIRKCNLEYSINRSINQSLILNLIKLKLPRVAKGINSTYPVENMISAVEAMREGASIRETSAKFGV